MTTFDPVQRQVLALDPSRHARVLGAPGTGKTRLLVEVFSRIAEAQGASGGEVLVIAPNRLVAAELRGQIERRAQRAFGGTFVRTVPSLAFSILKRDAAMRGVPAPRLLTGTAQDEAVEAVLEEAITRDSQAGISSFFDPQVMRGAAFRAELRELDRVLDDAAKDPAELRAHLEAIAGSAGGSASGGQLPHAEMIRKWDGALSLLERTRLRLAETRTDELSASAMQRVACEVLRENDALVVPALVLVDDAGELGEGALALLAAMVERGTKVWVFGDPDIATGSFQGERTRVISGLSAELNRKLHPRDPLPEEQLVTLEFVYRHGAKLRGLVTSLTERIGAAGAGQQRRATPAADIDHGDGTVAFATVASAAEQLGVVAHRLRAAHLGIAGAAPQPWSRMAVICRSRSDVKRVSRLLAAQQVPSTVTAGGVVLREHQLVRELIRLLQHALGFEQLSTADILEILGGSLGGLDPIAMRRLRGALRLREVRDAGAAQRPVASADALIRECFELPGEHPALDLRGARRLHRLGKLAASARAVHEAGGTPREVLWQIWEGSGLADGLQQQALDLRGVRSDDAHRALDAVVGLFFELQRHEEQASDRPVEAVLSELLESTVPSDSLAAASERDEVTVTTPQGVIGREFDLVCVLGIQDDVWPNLRPRGSLLGVTALERWLRGDAADLPSRRDTMHDELRLFAHAVARSRADLLVVAVSDEDQRPGPFFTLGRAHHVEQALPSSRLTLRGVVAEMRRRLTLDPSDREARDALVALAHAGVDGAHPDDWYGVVRPSSDAPLADIENDPSATVSVSPSQMERAETCPLDWVISRLGGENSNFRAHIGTLLHRSMELAAPGATAADLMETVDEGWGNLKFEAVWQEQRVRADTESMAGAVASYLSSFHRAEKQLLADEASFELPIGFVKLRGSADRIEAAQLADGSTEVTVVDLKTGRSKPTAAELEQHAQLQSYQLGVLRGAFVDGEGKRIEVASTGGAKLLFVHPETLNKTRERKGERYTEIVQDQLTEGQQRELEQRAEAVGRVMAGSRFIAQLEHHCESQYASSRACAIHIIPAVSAS